MQNTFNHTLMDWNLEDLLWLDVDDPNFGFMAQIGRIVKDGFVKDVLLLSRAIWGTWTSIL